MKDWFKKVWDFLFKKESRKQINVADVGDVSISGSQNVNVGNVTTNNMTIQTVNADVLNQLNSVSVGGSCEFKSELNVEQVRNIASSLTPKTFNISSKGVMTFKSIGPMLPNTYIVKRIS